MRKILLFFVAAAFLLSTFATSPSLAQAATLEGKIVKLVGESELYYIGLDGRAYVFPNEKTFRSWFVDFSTVQVVSESELSQYQLAGNVNYRPGIRLVKVRIDPRVYAVGNNGVLRWIKTEQLAKKLYGDLWNQLIDDVPAGFFTNYTIGEAIDHENDFNPDQEIVTSETIDDATQKIKDQIKELRKSLQELKKLVRARANSERKVVVCHNGKNTIVIGKPALPAHLAHGDTEGRCGDDDDDADTTAPVISQLSVSTATSTANITWLTNELSNSSVEYATSSLATASSTLKKSNNAKVLSHSIKLGELNPNTTYYYRVSSKDSAGNTATSTENTFTTTSLVDITAPIISSISVTASTTTSTVAWLTNELSDSTVQYATSTLSTANPITTLNNVTLTTSHSLGLIGLTASTTYFFIVKSKDSSNNQASSTEATFMTN